MCEDCECDCNTMDKSCSTNELKAILKELKKNRPRYILVAKSWRKICGPRRGHGFPRAKAWSWIKFEQKWAAHKGQRFNKPFKMMTWLRALKDILLGNLNQIVQPMTIPRLNGATDKQPKTI